MHNIEILDEAVVNQIKAGEVIENSASVVKELLENSLDSGAQHIVCEIVRGGREEIQIFDDGCGMQDTQLPLVFTRHATSKLRAFQDLQVIDSMGFRGEAMASIASVSDVEIWTRSSQGQGVKGRCVAGEMSSIETLARDVGTSIWVRDLFFNVPVRRNFLRQARFDTLDILRLFQLRALSHPHVCLKLISDGQVLLDVPGMEGKDVLQKRAQAVFPEARIEQFVPCDFRVDSGRVYGLLGSIEQYRPNRKGQILFVNERPVVEKALQKAVQLAYEYAIPNGKFPPFILFFSFDKSLVDINVHPQKKEIRLRSPGSLFSQIKQGVQHSLSGRKHPPSPPAKPLSESRGASQSVSWISNDSASMPPEAVEEKPHTQDTKVPSKPQQTALDRWQIYREDFVERLKDTTYHAPPQPQLPIEPAQEENPRIYSTVQGYLFVDPKTLPWLFGPVCQDMGVVSLRGVYALLQQEQGVVMAQSQKLMFGIPIRIDQEQMAWFQEAQKHLSHLGITIEQVGPREVEVCEAPGFSQEVIREMVDRVFAHLAAGQVGEVGWDRWMVVCIERKMPLSEGYYVLGLLKKQKNLHSQESLLGVCRVLDRQWIQKIW